MYLLENGAKKFVSRTPVIAATHLNYFNNSHYYQVTKSYGVSPSFEVMVIAGETILCAEIVISPVDFLDTFRMLLVLVYKESQQQDGIVDLDPFTLCNGYFLQCLLLNLNIPS
jgi:hypothetical protein